MSLPADPAEARTYLDTCHAWLMALDLTKPAQAELWEARVPQWCTWDRELRAKEHGEAICPDCGCRTLPCVLERYGGRCADCEEETEK